MLLLLGFLQRVDEGVRSTNTSNWDTYIQASGDFTKITERVERLDVTEC